MDSATEIINFAAASVALDLVADYSGTDADRDEITRNLAAYGPAIIERD